LTGATSCCRLANDDCSSVLSTFAGGCTLQAATSVCSDAAIHADAVLELLAHLVDKSLIVAMPQTNTDMRYQFLEIVRVYALKRLGAENNGPALKLRHMEFYLQLAERAKPEVWGPHQQSWLDHLELEHDNLRAALRTALDHRQVEVAACFVDALWRFWATRGHLSEGRAWIGEVLERNTAMAPGVRAVALNSAAWLALLQADYAAALTGSRECLTLRRIVGDVPGVAESLAHQAEVARQCGDHHRARTLIEDSLGFYRQTESAVGTADALNIYGMILKAQGNGMDASLRFDESLAIRRDLGDIRGIASTLANLGDLALNGDRGQAAEYLEESLRMRRSLGDSRGVATVLALLGGIAQSQGDGQRAETLYREGLELAGRVGAGRPFAACRDGLARLLRVATSTSC
jgi:tetratricopeptide (TPR) repeat protein